MSLELLEQVSVPLPGLCLYVLQSANSSDGKVDEIWVRICVKFLQLDKLAVQIAVPVHRGTAGRFYSPFHPFKTRLCMGPSLAR